MSHDIELAQLNLEMLKLQAELNKAFYWIEKLKTMKNEALIRQSMHISNIDHLKKDGVTLSVVEYGKIKEGLKRTKTELESLEKDSQTVLVSLKSVEKKLDELKSKYDFIYKLKHKEGTVLQFRKKND